MSACKSVPSIIYALMLEIERRRQELGWSQERLSEVAGIADRAYAKYLYPERSNGRVPTPPVLQALIATVHPDGFDLVINPRTGPALDAISHRFKVRAAAAVNSPRALRDVMRELGRKGGRSRIAKLSPDQISKLGERGGIASGRARRRKRERLQALQSAAIGPHSSKD